MSARTETAKHEENEPCANIDATKKLPGEGFKRPWPPVIKMDEGVEARVAKILNL